NMDKKSFEIVLDEIRKGILTDHRIKSIEYVHGYFSSEQVVELLKYFSWAEPQLKAVKALQHKMVAVHASKVINILNCFTFTKDKLVALELIALNVMFYQSSESLLGVFRFQKVRGVKSKKDKSKASKVGCKAPLAMLSNCGMIPGNPYPQGRPSLVNGIFPGTALKKENEECSNEGKGIAVRILGSCKPAPATYNPHKPVPYPIPPCRPHATISPSAYNNAGLVPIGSVIAPGMPPPPYTSSQTGAEKEDISNLIKPSPNQTFSRPASQAFSPHGSNASASSTPVATPLPTPSPAKPPGLPSTPATPVIAGLGLSTLVPSVFYVQTSSASPVPQGSSILASSVIKSLPTSVASAYSIPSTPVPIAFSGVPMPTASSSLGSSTPVSSVIRGHNSSVIPSATPVANGSCTTISTAFTELPASANPSPSPCGTPVPKGSVFAGLLSSVTHVPQITSIPVPSPIVVPSPATTPRPLGLSNPVSSAFKGFPSSEESTHINSSILTPAVFTGLPASTTPNHHGSATPGQSVIKSYTPSATPTPQESCTPVLPSSVSIATSASPAMTGPSYAVTASSTPAPTSCVTPASAFLNSSSPVVSCVQHGSSTSVAAGVPVVAKPEPSSPIPSAFKGPSCSATPSLGSLGLSVQASLGLNHAFTPSATPVAVSLPNAMPSVLSGLSSLAASLNAPSPLCSVTPASHRSSTPVFSGLPSFVSLPSNSALAGNPGLVSSVTPSASPVVTCSTTPSVTPTHGSTTPTVYPGLPPSATPSVSPFPLGLSTAVPSIFTGLPPSVTPGTLGSANPSFPGFAASNTVPANPALSSYPGLQASSTVAAVAPLPAAAAAAAAAASPATVLPGFASAFSSNLNSALVAQASLTSGLQTAGNAAFSGLLSFPGIPGFSQSAPQASLPGLQHAAAAQSALLQAHTASALESFQAQPNGFPNYPAAPGTPFTLQPGLHPQLGWQ
uniref:Proline and serine rich 1 n=1 Tax=Latimeria chalumnae TaxID=7897 RepID=H3AQF5_LATCH